MRVIRTIWEREFLVYLKDKRRIFSSIVSPIIMVLIFSFTLGKFDTGILGINSIQFLLPGILGMTVATTSLMESMSIVEDRSSGFMKEFLISPAKRSHIALGRIVGDSTKALIDSTILLIFSFILGVHFTFISLITIVIAMFIISLSFSAIGLVLANHAKSTRSYSTIIQLIMIPILFLSGSYFPINLIPKFIRWIVYFNPVTYVVSAFRYITLKPASISDDKLLETTLLLKIGDYTINPFMSLGMITLFGLLFLFLAVRSFKNINMVKKISMFES